MASLLEERFKAVISAGLTSTLAPLGFRKKGRVYTQQHNDLTWVVDVWRSRYNTRSEIEFTVDCGIYVPQVLPIYLKFTDSKTLSTVNCCIRAGIGTLAPDHQQIFWLLDDKPHREEHDPFVVAQQRRRTVDHILPFLARFPTNLEVATYLKQPHSSEEQDVIIGTTAMALGCAGIIHCLRNEPEEAADALAKAVEDAKGSRGARHLRDLQKRLMAAHKKQQGKEFLSIAS